MDNEDLAYAVFGLGIFIDYRLEDGMSEDALKPFMQAYLNIQARLHDQEPPDLDELRSRTVTDEPDLQQAILEVLPHWLPDCEKLRVYRRLR